MNECLQKSEIYLLQLTPTFTIPLMIALHEIKGKELKDSRWFLLSNQFPVRAWREQDCPWIFPLFFSNIHTRSVDFPARFHRSK